MDHRDAADAWGALELVAATDQGRGSAAMSAAVAGGLRRAVDLLTSVPQPQVVVLTGFAIPDGAGGWSPETDGPLGAVQLADCLVRLGWGARVLTDEPCAAVLEATAPGSVPVDVVPLPRDGGEHACEMVTARYRELGVTHVVSIERVGPSVDGVPRNMRGEDITAGTACLHHVATAGPWRLLAVGDGGNEIGMGAVPAAVVRDAVPLGESVRCTVAADAVVVAGTSNWGAAALVAGLALQTAQPAVLDTLAADRGHELLRRLLAAGAVDGVTRRPEVSVDGLPWSRYQAVVDDLLALARPGGVPA